MVVLDLRTPELRICLRLGCIPAILVPVPKAAVYKYACAILRQHDVGGAGESFLVDTVPIPEPEQFLAQFNFRFSIDGADVRHAGVALGRREEVGHDSVLLNIEYSAFYAGVRVWHFPAEVNI